MTEYVAMYHCIECGEDVPAGECYDDFGTLMHAIGVTGQAEPHGTGSEPEAVKRVDIEQFARKTPDFRHLAVRDVSAYLMGKFHISESEAITHAEHVLDAGLSRLLESGVAQETQQ